MPLGGGANPQKSVPGEDYITESKKRIKETE
jgi:hypothetical protein